jgi:NTE family protein
LVFKGGGVKGAALAGCLQAAIEAKVIPVGFGGASAGALVAALGSVGYSGTELLALMKNGKALNPRALLDDDGAALQNVTTEIERGKAIWREGGWTRWIKILNLLRRNLRDLEGVLKNGGLYHGERLRAALLSHLKAKLPSDCKAAGDVDFGDLPASPVLKIVASDLVKRRAAVFSAKHDEYGTSVIDAARASAGYPMVFRPVAIVDRLLSDGGLASNLPAFLFAEESRRTRYPILAFDLVTEEGTAGLAAVDQFSSILETALEASDDLLAQAASAYRVPIKIPGDIRTLDFDLTDSQIESLFHVGYKGAQSFFSNFKRLNAARSAGEQIVQELQAVYAPPKLIFPVLKAAVDHVGECTKAKGLRASIMLPTGRPDGSRIVVYPWNFRRDDSDTDLELAELGGCTGRAISSAGPIVADLEKAREDYPKYGMSSLQQGKVAKDRKSMISVPIFTRPTWTWTDPAITGDVLGVLSIDSETSLADTAWQTPDSKPEGLRIDERLVEGLIEWADVLTCLLQAERTA